MSGVRKTLSELAKIIDGRVIGDGSVVITGVASIEEAGPGDITFLAHPRYRSFLLSCKAGGLIIGPDIHLPTPPVQGRGYLEVASPYIAFAKILQVFHPTPQPDGTISAHAFIESSAVLGEDVTVYHHAYVGKKARIGRGSVLYPGVFLGEAVEVGDYCVLHANVVVREGCRLGNRVILHPGAVIGGDGFGYAGEGSQRMKIPQVGTVEIGDDVEIGSNTAVDRATLGKTVIGRGTKIDNLVHIAHNVVVGENSVIVAQVGIAGSTKVGNEVVLAGQVGVVNHIEIGDRVKVGPQSGIAHSVRPGAVLSSGIPAAPHREWLKVMTLLPQLPKLWRAVQRLEKKVEVMLGKSGKEDRSHA